MTRRRVATAILASALALAVVTRPATTAAAGPAPRTLRVFAAASLSDAFTELGRLLERQRPGLALRFSFAGSQQLAAQLDQGAAADVFASADGRAMDHARDAGLLAGAAVPFARNRLVVIVPRTNPARIQRLQDLVRGGVKFVIGADAVPVGHYSRTVLANLSRDPSFGADFATRALRNVVSEEENVKSVVGKVQLGEADAGIAYRSDVTANVARFVRVIEIPEGANVIAAYPIARLKGSGAAADDADAFVRLVLSPEGRGVLQRHGFLPVASARP